MKHSLQLRLSQHLTLTPQLQLSIRLLQLSTQELDQEIERFLRDNPLLERDEAMSDMSASGPIPPVDAREQAHLSQADEGSGATSDADIESPGSDLLSELSYGSTRDNSGGDSRNRDHQYLCPQLSDTSKRRQLDGPARH